MSTRSKGSKLVTADDGVAMVEYAIMVALIALVVIVATTALGQAISTFFINAANLLP